MRRRRDVLVAALGLLSLGGAGAVDTELAPSPAVQCLTQVGGAARLEYPPRLLQRKDGGTVNVELVFTGPAAAPRVEVLDAGHVFNGLADVVVAHVKRYRVPCMSDSGPPVVLRQSYVFVPNDGRKVALPATRDVADEGRRRQLACITQLQGKDRPEYSVLALQDGAQGNVLVQLRFSAADQPPEVEVLASARSNALRASVLRHVEGLRVPCLEGGPLVLTQLYAFRLDGGKRTLLRDSTLGQWLAASEDSAQPVYFDTATMDCPFDVRLTYMRPHRPNRVLELEQSVPARRPLLDWLSTLTLRLAPESNTAVLGQTMTLHVPCTTIDL